MLDSRQDSSIRHEKLPLDEIAALAASVDREGRFPRESLDLLSDVGMLGLMVPSDCGGSQADLTRFAETCRSLGTACASTAMVYLMHSVAAATLAGGGTSDDYLRRMADGEIGTLAFSERITGAHFYSPDIAAVSRDGERFASGRKSFVTSGGEADLYLLLVQSEDGADCYVVEAGERGVEFEGDWRGIGFRGNSSIAMELNEVRMTASARVGPAGGATELIFGVVAPTFLVGLAAVNAGIARAAVTAALDHVKLRSYADGSKLIDVQSVQQELAHIDGVTRTAELAVIEAATLADAESDDALLAVMQAKVIATKASAEVARRALVICGGQAITPDLPLERHLRDAQAGAVMAPTNGVLKNWIGKALAGLPIP